MLKTSLLIVEDYEPIVSLLQSTLSDEFHVMVADSVEQASLLIEREAPRLVLLDLGLPPKSSSEQGFRLLRAMQRDGSRCKTIVCTGYSERGLAVRAVRYGAFDVLYKPIDLSILKGVLRRAGWIAELEDEAREDGINPERGSDHTESIIGTSLDMRSIHEAVRQVAMTDVPVLIIGESGTGKELVARAIHERSARAAEAFVPVACSVIPGALYEAELFGYEPDSESPQAFRKMGKVESAKGGTLFLDEVTNVPAHSQETVVRVLDQRAGADVRILASSKHDPNTVVEEGLVRSDLLRQFPVHINLPPLRERGDDVLTLARIFLRRFAAQQSKPILGFAKDAGEAMRSYAWPDNVRELAGRVQRAVVVAEGQYIQAADLDFQRSEPLSQEDSISLKVNQQRIETDLIMKAFSLSRGNLSRAALELGISRSTLYRRIRQYGLDRAADAAVS